MAKLTQSYVHGVAATPLIGRTVGAFFDGAALHWANWDALIVRHQSLRWSYAELKEKVDSFATGLLALGLEPGDRIGIWSPNNVEWVITQFATAKAGLILVNINPAYRLSEADYALNKVGCKVLVTAAKFKTSDYIVMLNQLLEERRLPYLKTIIRIGGAAPGMLGFEEVAGLAKEEHRRRIDDLQDRLQFDDPINIQFTSGTTGYPKGATLTHHNILNNGFFIGETMRLTHEDRICIPVPLYHCFGMVLGNLACITHGSAMVYPGESFDPLAVLETVEVERCTGLYGVPTMFIAELDHPDFARFDLGTLRTGIMAGAPCPIEVMRKVIDHMNMREVTIAYQSGELPECRQRSTGASRFHRWPHSTAPRSENRRCRGPHRAARPVRRTLHPRLLRHARLLGR